MRCVNSGNCNCACSRGGCYKGTGHCNTHSNGCHMSCIAPEPSKEEIADKKPPRQRDGLGRYKKRQ